MRILKRLNEYNVSLNEIKDVENSIVEKGYWEEKYEWKISSVMISRIEKRNKNNLDCYHTTIRCEQEVVIPAATIEKALLFIKIYKDFQIELYHEFDWAIKPNIGFDN